MYSMKMLSYANKSVTIDTCRLFMLKQRIYKVFCGQLYSHKECQLLILIQTQVTNGKLYSHKEYQGLILIQTQVSVVNYIP